MDYKTLLNKLDEGDAFETEFSVSDKTIWVQRGTVVKTFEDWKNAYQQEYLKVVEEFQRRWPSEQFLMKDSRGLATIPNDNLVKAYIIKHFSKNTEPFDVLAFFDSNKTGQVNIETP